MSQPTSAQTIEPRYRWDCAHDWFFQEHLPSLSIHELEHLLTNIVSELDHDKLQDLFEYEMSEDHFFDKQIKEGNEWWTVEEYNEAFRDEDDEDEES